MGLLLLFSGCCEAKMDGAHKERYGDPDFQIVDSYVVKSRKWVRDQYRLEYGGDDGGEKIVFVIFLADEKSEGKRANSFEVHVKNGQVIKELAFQ